MQQRVKPVVVAATVTTAYVAGAALGFRAASIAEQVTTVWPPTGVAIAALLLFGRRFWPAVWVGAFAANATTSAPLWTAVAIATGNTLEAVAASWALSRVRGFDLAMRRTRDAVAFTVAAGVVTPLIAATIGASALCAAGVQPWSTYWSLWSDWVIGDALGALVIAPVFLTLSRTPRRDVRAQLPEAAVLVAAVLAVTYVVFSGIVPPAGAHPLEFIIFPFMITAAVRLGQPATSLVVLAASTVTILHTVQGIGPFANESLRRSLILLQVFMGVLASSGLVLAAAISERRIAERRRAAAHAVGRILADADGIEAAAPEILRSTCASLDWPVGGFWTLDASSQQLRCMTVWTESPRHASFIAVTAALTFRPGSGLPGRVWASGEPVWVEDVTKEANFPRREAARLAGLLCGFGFPICLGTNVVGVVEFFRGHPSRPDEDLLATMATVGNQIGQFIARKRVEVERSELLERERAARREAEDANHAKDQFLATLSHELRTPLNAIIGWTHMLLGGGVPPDKVKRALEIVDRNANAQAKLVSDLLDVSRIISGGLRLEVEPLDLTPTIQDSLDAVRPAAEAKQIDLRASLPAGPLLLRGDRARVRQSVGNLLSNAVKFTPEGGRVDLDVRESAETISLSVRDTGMGIPPEFLPHVFERFRQADGSSTRQHAGLGLGLAIVRHLVELHQGTVQAESDGAGKGAVFTVELPRVEDAVERLPDAEP